MGVPTIQAAVNGGEFSPELFGRVDLEKYRRSCSTLRNFFSSYRGGAVSRAGTKFVGFCKQGQLGAAATVVAPRNITFQYSVTQGIVIEAGDHYFRFVSNGAYVTEAPISITGITTADPAVISLGSVPFSDGDEVYLSGINGPAALNNQTYIVDNATATTFTLVNPLTGAAISSASLPAYVSGGTAARVYTLTTPYAAADLAALKFTQSADVMSFTHPSYPPYDLVRISSASWTITKTDFGANISAPASISLTETDSGLSTPSFYYQFVATAVDADTGQESVASPVGTLLAVDVGSEAATIFINCAAVSGAGSYNFYQGPVAYKNPPTAGALFGFVGSSYGPSFTDTNIVPDFNTAPPLHLNPFATSSVTSVVMTSGGTSYSNTATTAVLTSPIGKNPVLLPVVVGGQIVWTSVQNGGEGMTGGEAITFIDATASGSGATATFTVGPSTGTFPSCVAYFQQRRFYANTTNNPDTYFASQPGAFTNMDSSLPVKDDDAIIGSPWSQQVNGIQWMVNMPGGLVVLTGLGAWQLSGGGGGLATASAITPSNQVATPQAYNGVSPTVPPIVISYDMLYVQEKGSIVRDLSYNVFANIYTGTDLTVLSNHLFAGHTILEWAWAEEPYKLVWAVRDDGILLCLTYLKEQEVFAWSRHDTNGLFQSVCSVSEPPVNAPYFIVKRLIQNNGNPIWAYCQERMDNRIWPTLEDSWCVDCGLSYPQNEPAATLYVSSADGVSTLQNPTVIYGGSNYGASTYARIDDPTGAGAILTLTIVAGVITAAVLSGVLTGYTNPTVTIVDPSGAGGNGAITVEANRITTVSTLSGVFANTAGFGAAGDVIRMGGRVMEVTAYGSTTSLTVRVVRNDAASIPNDPYDTPVPAPASSWTIAAPVTTVTGLGHLEGMLVSILADGVIVEPQTVTDGTITLPEPATSVVVGLGFAAQLQTLYLDIPGGITIQGRRKEIDTVVVRVWATGVPFKVGTNQPDASIQPGGADVPWTNMTDQQVTISTSNPIQPFEFYSGDIFTNVIDEIGYDRGQIAIEQLGPVPLNVLAVIPWSRTMDGPDL